MKLVYYKGSIQLKRIRFTILSFVTLILIYLVWYLFIRETQILHYPLEVDLYKLYEQSQSGICGSSEQVQPLNPIIFDTVLTVNNQCQSKLDTEILILVKSALDHSERRNAIRRTWGNPDCIKNAGNLSQTLFILARPNAENWTGSKSQDTIIKESQVYNDIVQFDIIESYQNLAQKVMATLAFVVRCFSHIRFLVLIDDDFLVHPPNLVRLLSQVTKTQYHIYVAGDVLRNPRPVRFPFHKWYISYSDYSSSFYPPFPSGGTVILSMPMVQLISFGLCYTKSLPFDDVLLGLVLLKYGISPVHLDHVYSIKTFDNNIGELISAHGFQKPSFLLETWLKTGLYRFCTIIT